MRKAIVALFVAAIGQAALAANILVVDDSVCPTFAVDIESFASCDGDRVASLLTEQIARAAYIAMTVDEVPDSREEREGGAIAPR